MLWPWKRNRVEPPKVPRAAAVIAMREGLKAVLTDRQSIDPGLFAWAVETQNPSIQKATDNEDPDLARLYTFADYVSFCRAHRDKKIDGLSTEEAEAVLQESLDYLEGRRSSMPDYVLTGRIAD